MSSHRTVYVFVSGDRRTFGLSSDPDGANLPPASGGWQSYDEIPVCLGYLGRYAENPETARANLATRGYHLASTIGRIVQRPKTKLCSIHYRAA